MISNVYGNDEEPHSPCIRQRETLDGGFSKGLGFHYLPNEAYWLDCHNHLLEGETPAHLYKLLDEWFGQLDAYRLGKIIAIASNTNAFGAYACLVEHDERFAWIFSIAHDKPDLEELLKARQAGVCGIKLHNAPIMKGEAKPDIWLNESWDRMFSYIQTHQLPILWHVTQRLSESPYHGGGAYSYWEEGYKKGVDFTNEDLLNVTLAIAKTYPDIQILGAHQLHVGLDRLSEIFDTYRNLSIDTSCTFFLRWGDSLYDNDKKVLREFFTKYQDRILFGTDSLLAAGTMDAYKVQSFLCHVRFIKQLQLHDEVLQKISHGNAERLFHLKPVNNKRRGSARP